MTIFASKLPIVDITNIIIMGNQNHTQSKERCKSTKEVFLTPPPINTYRMDISDMRNPLPTISIQILNSIEKMQKDAGFPKFPIPYEALPFRL